MSGSSLMILAIPARNSGWLSRLRIRMRVASGASGSGETADFCDGATCQPARLAFVDGGRRVPSIAGPAHDSGIGKERFPVAGCVRIMSDATSKKKEDLERSC